MIEEASDDAALPVPTPSTDPGAKAPVPRSGFLPGRPIEVAAAGSGTTNDPSATDTRPPGGGPPPPGA
jgi:hypothetical protein